MYASNVIFPGARTISSRRTLLRTEIILYRIMMAECISMKWIPATVATAVLLIVAIAKFVLDLLIEAPFEPSDRLRDKLPFRRKG